MGLGPVRWGILSTAHINRLRSRGRTRRRRSSSSPSRAATMARADEYAQEWGIERAYGSYEALLADPEIEAVYISLPNTLHCRVVDQGARGGQARALREAALAATLPTSRPRSTPPSGRAASSRRRSCTGTTRRPSAPAAACRGRRDRRAATRPLGVQLRALRRRQHPAAHRRGGRLADGRRLLLRQRLAPVRGRAGAGVRRGSVRRDRHRLGLHRARCAFPGDVLAQFDCGTALSERDELEVVGSEGSLFLDDPWHCRRPVIELRRGGEVERIELEPVDSYRLELENLSDAIRGAAEPLLGRRDALGQSRALEALFASATEGIPISL